MLQKIRKSKLTKIISVLVAQFIVFEIISPMQLWALTGGPSQPEVQSFEPVGTSEMVDLFTGDFNYNIPLLDVGGYPINLIYNAGATMDQEASWVGLGWNINPGVINRNMRALPDDFNGDEVVKEFNMKKNETYGINVGAGFELFGLDFLGLNVGLGFNYNNYRGYGFEISLEPSISASNSNYGEMTASLGLSASSSGGVGIEPNISFKTSNNYFGKLDSKIGSSFNTREGLSAINVSYGINTQLADPRTSNISFAYKTFTPQIDMSMVNSNISLSFTFGAEVFGSHVNFQVGGYYSSQKIKDKVEKVRSYGYMYLQEGDEDENASLDFNREKDGSFTKHKPNLPLTNLTYDVYSVSGQGIGGVYRPFRSDYGIVYDKKSTNESDGVSLGGIEIGIGNGVHVGLNLNINSSNSVSRKWTDNNLVYKTVNYKGKEDVADKYYEPFYFKQAGEKTSETSPEVFESLGSYKAVMIDLEEGAKNPDALLKLRDQDKKTYPLLAKNYRENRQRRNQVIQPMVAEDAMQYGLDKEIKSYPSGHNLNSNGNYISNTGIPRTAEGSYRKGHHISEITTFRTDGVRYIYGIPAYNTKQEDVSFAIEGGNPDCSTGLVSYDHGSDNTTNNCKGINHYYNKTIMPAYAHSFLLTAVLSPDYVDVLDDGPSDDDLGSYTKINYLKIDNYKWRVPYEKQMANYNEGFKSKENTDEYSDDMANYIYGEKELWYMHSIETKTHVAEFITSDRCDGFEVESDKGGKGSKSTKKLVRIDLFSKQDKLKNGANAVPIKSVHFEYDYSLCPNIPNNSKLAADETGSKNTGGKLTLKKVYFTYQNSKRGKLNPYVFDYSELRNKNGELITTINPSYNLKGYDRWGSFMPNTENGVCSIDAPLTNPEYPYTKQEKIKEGDKYNGFSLYEEGVEKYWADIYSVAWNLTSIELPSGGKIKVDYESDDYSHVQDRKAMQMFKVVAAEESAPVADNGKVYNEIGVDDLYNEGNKISHSYLVVKLSNPYIKELSPENFRKDFLTMYDESDIKQLYFKFLVDVAEDGNAWEYVTGYAAPADLTNNANYGFINKDYGFIKIKDVVINDEKPDGPLVNQISQAGWNFVKVHMPQIAYGGDEVGGGILGVFDAMVSTLKQIGDLFSGFYGTLRSNNASRDFKTGKSWVRLYNPEQMKKGGGCRVKMLSLNDQWKELTGLNNYRSAEYGQVYDYTVNDGGEAISSGVAAYEPIVGGEENPFKVGVFYEEKNLLVPSDDYYMEEPFGESFFPGASVGYRKVVVKNLQHEGVTKNATGRVEHEFYTAKDFPTNPDQTKVKQEHDKSNSVMELLNIDVYDHMTASQGYVIELNDMHGKPRSQKVFPENSDATVSEVEYKYKTSSTGKSLANNVQVVEKDGSISEKTVGVDYDLVMDMREQQTETVASGFNGNLDVFVVGIFPVVVPVVFPKYSSETVRFRSAVVTKVINRYGLLESVTAKENGSVITTSNILYDAETGEVLLTETQNQYNDPVYAFTYPAHWAYDRMGPAYKNIGVTYPGNSNELVEGDEVVFDGNRGWVTNVAGGVKILNKDGEYYASPDNLTVVRSGRKNRQALPVASITSLANPILNNTLSFSQVLNASAVEYTDEAGVFCGECGLEPGMNYNPYIAGSRGSWKQQRSYVYLTDRIQSRANNNTYIRKDGIYKDFTPFWTANNGLDWNKNTSNPKWVSSSEVTIFSPYGSALENKDALGRYSSAVYGYNQILPVATASNAMYKEIAFDGFEDYDLDKCDKDHFSYEFSINENGQASITQTESHTGRSSIMVEPGVSIGVRKVVIPCEQTK